MCEFLLSHRTSQPRPPYWPLSSVQGRLGTFYRTSHTLLVELSRQEKVLKIGRSGVKHVFAGSTEPLQMEHQDRPSVWVNPELRHLQIE